MSTDLLNLFWPFSVFIILMCVIGVYYILATHNLIRALIGVELLLKALTLLIILVGYITGNVAMAQSLVITFIVIEVVVITIAMGVILGIHKQYNSLDAKDIRTLKG